MRLASAVGVAVLALLLALPAGAAQRSKYDYDALGAEFCRLTLAGDMAGLRPLISDDLARAIEAAAARAELLPPQQLFQSYTNVVPECEAHTRNAAIVEIRRSRPGGAAPAWSEYLVIVPQLDGTSRVDDVLFATRRSDTLRNRLSALAGGN
jgi:hypothetical protein